MILRIKLPQPLFLYAPYKDALEDVSVSFTFRGYAVTLTADGGEVEKATWAKPVDLYQWYRKATQLMLTIAETDLSPHRIPNLITAPLHEELLKICLRSRCMILLSGYDNPLYQKMLVRGGKWSKKKIETHTRDTTGTDYARTEVLWMNAQFTRAFNTGRVPIRLSKSEKQHNKVNPSRKG